MPAEPLPLTESDVVRIEHRARRAGCGNCWTGTSGTLAAHVMRLLAEVRRLQVEAAMAAERPCLCQIRGD